MANAGLHIGSCPTPLSKLVSWREKHYDSELDEIAVQIL